VNLLFLGRSYDRPFLYLEIKIIEGEIFDENSLICPTCGQKLPEEQAEKIRAEFEEKKNKGGRVRGREAPEREKTKENR